MTSPGLGEPQWLYTLAPAAALGRGVGRAIGHARPHLAQQPAAEHTPSILCKRGDGGSRALRASSSSCSLGTPIAVALGLAGTLAIFLADLGNMLATPTSAYTGIAKYPLLAVPMFVLVGADLRPLRRRARGWSTSPQALIGRGAGSLAAVTVIVSMFLGGISGSGPANAAAVGGVMMGALYAGRLPARLLGERHRRRGGDRHPDPALDRAHHLQRAGAAGLRAGAVRGRHDPRHPGRRRASSFPI